LSARSDLAGFIDVASHEFDVFIVNLQIFVGAELTILGSGDETTAVTALSTLLAFRSFGSFWSFGSFCALRAFCSFWFLSDFGFVVCHCYS
jgi:hypothetical protein